MMDNEQFRLKPIDNVTVELLGLGLRLIGVKMDMKTLDKLIDIIELIEDKGGEAGLADFAELEKEWNQGSYKD